MKLLVLLLLIAACVDPSAPEPEGLHVTITTEVRSQNGVPGCVGTWRVVSPDTASLWFSVLSQSQDLRTQILTNGYFHRDTVVVSPFFPTVAGQPNAARFNWYLTDVELTDAQVPCGSRRTIAHVK